MIQLDVTIMGQPFKLACKEGEQSAVQAAVDYLNDRMCTIRDVGKIKGNDRIAVMAALGMAAELMGAKSPQGPPSDMSMAEMKQKIFAMHMVLDGALAGP